MSATNQSGAQMQQLAMTELRLALLQRGYHITPNLDKRCVLKIWNTPEFLKVNFNSKKQSAEDRVRSWPQLWPDFTATGVRLDDGLCVLDNDADDPELAEAFWRAVEQHAPSIATRSPARYGSGTHKVALFARFVGGLDESFVKVPNRSWTREGEDKNHKLEIFGGKPTTRGHCSRQFGIYGPNDIEKGIQYAWGEGPQLRDVALSGLPALTRAQAYAIQDTFDAEAARLGWQEVTMVRAPIGGAAVYDITPDTRFDTDSDRSGISYAELCDEYEIQSGSLRCSSNFMPGRGRSGDTSRCLVGANNQHDAVAVWVPGDETIHYPVELQGATVDTSLLGSQLLQVAAVNNIEPPISEPNWRERYVESQRPKPTFHNARLAIAALKYQCWSDTFHNRQMMGREALETVSDSSIGLLRVLLSKAFGLDFGERHVRDAITTMCEENRFDPVVEMLADAQASWDGVKRLDRMAVDYFNCADTELNAACVRKTMIAAVARARIPGVKFDTILTMESKEGWNKSSAWAVLAGADNFSDASVIGHQGREVQEQLRSCWIHENAELAGMRKTDIEMVKAFASRQVDRARPAYGHFLIEQPRHSIEVATTNSARYLQSHTGNRRFWPIAILAPISLRRLSADRLQLWGEAAHYQAQGELLTLDERLWPLAAIEQEARRVEHPWEALLAGMVEAPSSGILSGVRAGSIVLSRTGDELRVHSRTIFTQVLELHGGQMNRGHATTLGELMRLQGWEHRDNIRVDGAMGSGYVKMVPVTVKKVTQ